MCWIWSILTVPFPCNMNSIALGASPLLCINLPAGDVNFLLVDDYDMMRNTMCLIGRFWPVFNICISHN